MEKDDYQAMVVLELAELQERCLREGESLVSSCSRYPCIALLPSVELGVDGCDVSEQSTIAQTLWLADVESFQDEPTLQVSVVAWSAALDGSDLEASGREERIKGLAMEAADRALSEYGWRLEE